MSGYTAPKLPPKPVSTPFTDPSLGVEQFFDPDGPGPTQLDIANYALATGSKKSPTGFPAIDKKIENELANRNTFPALLSRGIQSITSTLKTTLVTIIVIALGVSFAFFALKRLAEKV